MCDGGLSQSLFGAFVKSSLYVLGCLEAFGVETANKAVVHEL